MSFLTRGRYPMTAAGYRAHVHNLFTAMTRDAASSADNTEHRSLVLLMNDAVIVKYNDYVTGLWDRYYGTRGFGVGKTPENTKICMLNQARLTVRAQEVLEKTHE